MKKAVWRILSGLLAAVMVFALVGCNKSAENGDAQNGDEGGASGGSKKVMRFMSNIQDREHTEGLVEQMQLDKWLKQNPDFSFDYEFVPNSDYQTKLAQYQATDNLPDVFKEWGGSVNFDQRIINKMQIPIWDSVEQANEEGYDYPDGVLSKMQLSDGSDPAVYATAVNFDFFCWFYNGEIFAQEGWEEPKTWDELVALLDDMSAKGYVPCSFSGKDIYQGAALIEELIQKISGDNDLVKKIIEGDEPTFSENTDARAAFEATKELVDHNLTGGTDWLAQDYAGARGLFVNGQIPLYYFGSWEYMMIADDQLPQSFRDNVDFFLTPLPDGAKGDMGMFQGYTGCGFAVASKSQYKDDALALLKFYFKKENYCKDAWEMKVFIPAQNFSEFQSDDDPRLQKKILEVMETRTSVLENGAKLQGYSNTMKALTDPYISDFFAGAVDVEEVLAGFDTAAAESRAEVEMLDA